MIIPSSSAFTIRRSSSGMLLTGVAGSGPAIVRKLICDHGESDRQFGSGGDFFGGYRHCWRAVCSGNDAGFLYSQRSNQHCARSILRSSCDAGPRFPGGLAGGWRVYRFFEPLDSDPVAGRLAQTKSMLWVYGDPTAAEATGSMSANAACPKSMPITRMANLEMSRKG